MINKKYNKILIIRVKTEFKIYACIFAITNKIKSYLNKLKELGIEVELKQAS